MSIRYSDGFDHFGKDTLPEYNSLKAKPLKAKPLKPPKRFVLLDDDGNQIWSFTPAGSFKLDVRINGDTWLVDIDDRP